MKRIELSGEKGKGKFILCDDEDFGKLSQYKWWCEERNDRPYTQIKRKTTHPEKIVMGKPPKGKVWDHADRNPYNNRKENLRPATQRQNMCNRSPSDGKGSKYKGVHFSNKQKRWVAKLQYKGKLYLNQLCETEVEAAFIYNQMAREVFGEFAYLNDVPENIEVVRLFEKVKQKSSSKYVGVRKRENDYFNARLNVGGKEVSVSYCRDELKAALDREFIIQELNLNSTKNDLDLSYFEPTEKILKKLEECRKLLNLTEKKQNGILASQNKAPTHRNCISELEVS